MVITPGVVLDVMAEATDSMKKRGILDAAGNFAKAPALTEADEVAGVVADVESALKAKGLVVPAQVDKAIAMLPAALTLIGQVMA